MIRYRPFDDRSENEVAKAYRLWTAALGDLWPISPAAFRRALTGNPDYRPGDHFVAETGGRIVGLVASQVRRTPMPPSPQGGIALLMVDPAERRRGIGAALHRNALDHARREGMTRARLGAGTSARFWNGVPDDLPGAVAFFESQGWSFTETAHDLTRSLADYETPPEIMRRVREAEVRIEPAAPGQVADVLRFEDRRFPNWAPYFRRTAEQGRSEDILAAWNRHGEVVGTLLTFSADSPDAAGDRIWTGLLGESMGGLGAVGVAEEERGKGIGIGMVARASEILKARGVGNSHIGWTWLLDFYGRLGYRRWRSFKMSARDLS
jgi:beta-N-acetylhexosaminidase